MKKKREVSARILRYFQPWCSCILYRFKAGMHRVCLLQ